MAVNEMPFRPVNWGGQTPHSPSTGHHEAEAGNGTHASLSAQRWAGRRHQFAPLPIPKIASPLQANEAAVFADEFARDNHRNVGRDMVVGAVLGYALTRYAQARRGVR